MRDIAIVSQLQRMADVEVDWLAPSPAGGFLTDKGYHVLECSNQLAGSGKVYDQVFKDCTYEFNLINYIRMDTKLHLHDFRISTQAWKSKKYDVIVGDEAFWLLSGFCLHLSPKPAPFVFLTDFIGVKAMRYRVGDILTAWLNNLMYTRSYIGPDEYVYIGDVREIPDERFGLLLPSRQRWAQRHCRFVKPIVNFNPDTSADRKIIRNQLGLPEDKLIFLAVIGPEGDYTHRMSQIEKTFELLKQDFSDAHFIMVGPEMGIKRWVQYHRYLEKLHEYFAASDLVLIQSGYGKVVELSALGIPFIAIPLDYHFEQEYVMAHRMNHYGTGKLMTLRHNTPDEIAAEAEGSLKSEIRRISVDIGTEVGNIILATTKSNAVYF
ncbi:MAG: hypothetical protein JXM72_03475 [Deltaproteobacteria bacterium]|nr:hypothetical protein [Deltaproteobacteria bacterium]